MPERVRLSRKKGYRKPEGAIVVARPSKWGNPFHLHGVESAADIVAMFRSELIGAIERPFSEPHPIEFRIMAESLEDLRGNDLACWCGLSAPCHADVLLELSNR